MVTPQQELWQRQAVFSNLASQGAAVQSSMLAPGPTFADNSQQRQALPIWGAWAATEKEHRMDLENSSADSMLNQNQKLELRQQYSSGAEPPFEPDSLPKMEAPNRSVLTAQPRHLNSISP